MVRNFKKEVERNKKISIVLTGRKLSEEHKNNLSKNHRHYQSKETRERIRKSAIKRVQEGTHNLLNHKYNSPELIRKRLQRHDKSSLEIKFEDIINKMGLPYKFVGNGEVIIARKCPDFVNSKGEKIAIEVYYRKHKNMFRNGLEEWKAERIKLFNKNGWKIIFFDETEIQEEIIINKLRGGIENS